MDLFFFLLFAVVSVLGAFGVVLLPNLFHAALALVTVLIMGAAIFIMLSAEFIAVAQVLIYAGAIVVLMVFAIMLTKKIQRATVRTHNEMVGISAALCIAIFALLIWSLLQTPWVTIASEARGGIPDVGRLLLSLYVLPFELVSVVLLFALIGGIILAREN